MYFRYLKYIALWALLIIAIEPANARDAIDSGTTQLSGSKFNYSVTALGSKDRRIEVIHNGEKYGGPLGAVDSYLSHRIVAAIAIIAR